MSTESKVPEHPPELIRPGFRPGQSGNPGGRPKRLIEIEAMLNERHRRPEVIDMALTRALELGLRGGKGDSAYLKLYFERVLGPVKELIPEDWLADAPKEVLEWLRQRN